MVADCAENGKGLYLSVTKVLSEKPKGATEVFEIRVTWPSSIAIYDGEVTSVNSDKIPTGTLTILRRR